MGSFEKLSVMVVDDVQTMQTHVMQTLEPFRFGRVEAFSNGEEAIMALQKESYHLLIVDLHMRPSDGMSFLKFVRSNEKFKHLPFIMLSVDAVESQVQEVIQHGVDDYMLKPLNSEKFLDRVLEVLQKRGMV